MTRHDLDPLSLVFGLLFLGIGAWVAAGEFDLPFDHDWVWSALAIGAGALLVLPAVGRLRADRRANADEALDSGQSDLSS